MYTEAIKVFNRLKEIKEGGGERRERAGTKRGLKGEREGRGGKERGE